jgi:dCTP deaminase
VIRSFAARYSSGAPLANVCRVSNGILVYQQIRALIESGVLHSTPGIGQGQIQPSSLDLRLATRGYRVRSGFLPENVRVADRLEEMTLYAFDLTDGAVLEKGHCYIVPLLERIEKPLPCAARANPKSSTGRLDMFTRLLADRCGRFETVPQGYTGPLFLEIVPRSFPVRVRTGLSLCQLRFAQGDAELGDDELRAEYGRAPLLFDDHGRPLPLDSVRIDRGLCMGVALRRDRDLQGPVGYAARRYTPIVDTALEAGHEPDGYFEAIAEPKDGRLIVEPEEFYIFASKERIRVPRHLAAEMAAYDVGIGELRTNYAGFFDNGFGGDRGTRAVLEVRPHDVPFLLEDGQVFFKLSFFRTLEDPEIVYGDKRLSSHYQGQALRLSKHFRG